jgi:organic radical activating enzyme
MMSKYFPIQTATACKLKWSWSTIYLNTGVTRSCHRTAESDLTPENFVNFHNTQKKITDRLDMLNGMWPVDNCNYCKYIELAGGVSDRIRQQSIQYDIPEELLLNPTATHVSPTILEVYFNNTCNLGCLYCDQNLSSTIQSENEKFGYFEKNGVVLTPGSPHFKELVSYFWDWFPKEFSKISRLQILGGEPFYQKDFDKLLKMIDQFPNKNCELNIVTNLMITSDRLEHYIKIFKSLLTAKKLKRIDVTCSIDCWGPEQEYVRYGLNLLQWENNFNQLIKNKWLYININQTISVLAVKTMPELLIKLANWRLDRHIGHWFSEVSPGPEFLKLRILDKNEFIDDVDKILSLMPIDTDENKLAYDYMKGILTPSTAGSQDKIIDLITYLDEKDRRRNTNWEKMFPWLVKYKKYVV